MDPAGIIIRVNQAELDLLGYSREEYFGHHINEFHVDPQVSADILRRLKDGELLRDYEARLRCKDNSIKYVRINSSGYWEDGRFCHESLPYPRHYTGKRTESRLALQYAVTKFWLNALTSRKRRVKFCARLANILTGIWARFG